LHERSEAAGDAPDQGDSLARIAARALTVLALAVGTFTCTTWLLWAAGALPGEAALAAWRGIAGALLLGAGGIAWLVRKSGHDALAGGLVLLSCQAAATVHALGTGLGVHTLAMTSSALALAVSGLLLSARLTVALAAVYAAAVAALYAAERAGAIAGQALSSTVSAEERLITHTILVLAGAIVALLAGRLLRRTLRRLQGEQARLKTLLAIGSDWTWESNARGDMLQLSAGFEERSGIPRALGLALNRPGGPQFVHDEHWRAAVAFFKAAKPYRDLVLNYRLPDGSTFSVRTSGEPVRDAAGRLIGWRGASRNITAEVARQREHTRSQALFDRIVQVSPDAIAVARADGAIERVNAGFERLAAMPAERIVGHSAAELGLWSFDEQARLARALFAAGSVQGFRTRVRAADGGEREVAISAAVLAGSLGEGPGLAVITTRDITEDEHARLQAEAILDSAAVGIALVRQHRFVRVNPQWEAMLGHPRGSLAGQETSAVFPNAEAFAAFVARSAPALSAGRTIDIEREIPRRDGGQVRLRLRARALDPARLDETGTLWLAEDVTERRDGERALAEAKQAAEAASQAKSAFLATMSHEIRTPLNGVLGLARLLQDETLGAGRRRELQAHLLDSAQALAGLVSDVLDLSKIEAGHLALEQLPFDPRELVAALYASFEPLANERGLGLAVEVAAEVPAMLLGDPVRLRQILANYLANAVKFTSHGQIRVALTRTAEGWLRLAVADTGPGVPLAVQPRLFHPFVQADGSTTRRFGGTGLGLSICRELAERMGGAVGVDSDGSHGSVFWAELPLPAAEPAPAAEAAAAAVPDAADIAARDPGGAHEAPAGNAAAAAPPLAGRRLLVAEDNPVNLLIVVALLERLGAAVVQACDGQQAVALARRHAPELDAVLMDLHMPVMDGLTATRALRADAATAALPVLALSAAVLDHEREAARAAGMAGFVAKPVQEAELLRALAASLRPGATRPAQAPA
jgi:PAS domain S-box-containing protein